MQDPNIAITPNKKNLNNREPKHLLFLANIVNIAENY